MHLPFFGLIVSNAPNCVNGCLSYNRHGVIIGQIEEVRVTMDVKDIGKMILDGNIVEIIMRESQIHRKQAIGLWYCSYTRNRVYATKNDHLQIDARQCFEELMKERGLNAESRIPNKDKDSAFATQVAARIISTVMHRFDCDFEELTGLFDTYPKVWADIISRDTELYEIGKSDRLEYTINFLGELLHEERAGIGRLCYKDGTPCVVKYPVRLDGQEYAKMWQWFFEENIRYSRLSSAPTLRKPTDNFIMGSHSDPLICLGDNTVSAWYNPNTRGVRYIKSGFCDNGYYAAYVDISRVDVLKKYDALEEIKELVLEDCQLDDKAFRKLPTRLIIEYCSNSLLMYFEDLKIFHRVEDLLEGLIPIKGYLCFKDLEIEEHNRILAEVGLF